MAIYIPSKKRAAMAAITVPKILEDGDCPVYVFVEADDEGEYRQVLPKEVTIIVLSESNKGVSYARNCCIGHAYEKGYRSVVMTDDDVTIRGSRKLLTFCDDHPRVGAIAGYFGIYKRFCSLDPGQGPVRHTGTLGQVCYAFRPGTISRIGGWDERLHRKEDYDLRIRLMKQGHPWYVHTDVEVKVVGRQYGEGGIQSLHLDPTVVEKEAYRILVEKHGDRFIKWQNSGRTNVRVLWKRMCEHYGC